MTEVAPAIQENQRSPFVRGRGARIATGLLMVAGQLATLSLMGRNLVCHCEGVRLLQTSLSPLENSQQFADAYSLLHVVFGMALALFVVWMRPNWRLSSVLLAVIFGHAIWEVAENTPFVIDLFTYNPAANAYEGDSLLNSLGDTIFALGGALLVPALPFWVLAFVALAVELAVTLTVGDGFVVGTLRVLGLDI